MELLLSKLEDLQDQIEILVHKTTRAYTDGFNDSQKKNKKLIKEKDYQIKLLEGKIRYFNFPRHI